VQADILDGCPNNGQATRLRRKHINLIGALPYIAEETFDRIGRLKIPMHARWKVVKGQGVFFVLKEASDRFRIALSVLGLKGSQVYECLLLIGLTPDANQLRLNVSTLPSGNGIEHIALLVHQTSLTRSR